MNETAVRVDRAMQAQIDRLVSGDLPESERRSLLAWLDEDVRRWRACAVAYLEAQTWEAATAIWPVEASTGNQHAATPLPETAATLRNGGDHGSKQQGRSPARLVAIAALALAIAAAFVMGAVLGRQSTTDDSRPGPTIVEQPATTPRESQTPELQGAHKPLVAMVSVRSNLDPQVPLQLQVPVSTTARPNDAGEIDASAISDYERQQWERLGFEVIEEQRYLPARMPDGRQVVVPVNKVRLKFKGTPVS